MLLTRRFLTGVTHVQLDHTKQNLSARNDQVKKNYSVALIKIDQFSSHIWPPKLLHWGFCLYFSALRAYKCPIEREFKLSARVRQSSVPSSTLWACVNFFGQITVQTYFVFVSTVGLQTLYIREPPHMNTFCERILKKIAPTYAHFQYYARKLISLKSVLLWGILQEN